MSRKKKSQKSNSLNNEIISLFIIAMGILIWISIQTQSAGEIGRIIKLNLMGLLSTPVYLLPYLIILVGVYSIIRNNVVISKRVKYASVIIYIGCIMLYTLHYMEYIPDNILDFKVIRTLYNNGNNGLGGGLIGGLLGYISIKLLGIKGSYLVIITMLMISFMLITKISFIKIIKNCKRFVVKGVRFVKEALVEFVQVPMEKTSESECKKEKKNIVKKQNNHTNISSDVIDEKIKILDFTKDADQESNIVKKMKNINAEKESVSTIEHSEIDIHIDDHQNTDLVYKIPSFELLDKNVHGSVKDDKKEILHKAKILEETLGNFGVDAKVVQVSKGPTITRYEIQPSPGVKVSKIVNLADDIALNLAASNIRIEAPIPGKAAVGIEIPNESISMVTIREVLESDIFTKSKSKLTFVLGKDIAGNPIATDLSKMPHMLIAGATGSGKSVCINTLITSILYKSTPQEVKLILIDPKVVELNNYNGIPHLLLPVVTDPQKASSALNWAVQEMTRRYKAFAQNNVRDIVGYNNKMITESKDHLPKIVVIIDELADLMMVSPGQVEDSICRLAQMARAAGIHLIVATQRPSVDIITGVIKANIPSRIAFSVSSQVDSRTILDMGGAEKLLGKGDMLFYPMGASKPIRVQGAYISDSEVEKVINFVKQQAKEDTYEEEIMDTVEKNLVDINNPVDELLKDAIELVVDIQQASISMLQRRFRIGYNRSARLIDEMEVRGIVGEHEGSKPRRVIISKDEFEEMKNSVKEGI
ncbi:DNA translocase FtsK [Lutibacter sp. B2]|nr:DNA translocase FtsK [Lutibacter sp. B2]